MNCWEYNKCGREKGGANAKSHGVCAAWPDKGQRCAFIVGTMGESRDEKRVSPAPSCWICDFYRQEHHFKNSGAKTV